MSITLSSVLNLCACGPAHRPPSVLHSPSPGAGDNVAEAGGTGGRPRKLGQARPTNAMGGTGREKTLQKKGWGRSAQKDDLGRSAPAAFLLALARFWPMGDAEKTLMGSIALQWPAVAAAGSITTAGAPIWHAGGPRLGHRGSDRDTHGSLFGLYLDPLCLFIRSVCHLFQSEAPPSIRPHIHTAQCPWLQI